MGEILAVVWIWFGHAVVGALLAAPIFLWGRRRANWSPWELFVFVIPFGVWWILMASELSTGKSLANLGESLWIALLIPVAVAMHVMVGQRLSARLSASLVVSAVSVAAIVVFFATPPLPE